MTAKKKRSAPKRKWGPKVRIIGPEIERVVQLNSYGDVFSFEGGDGPYLVVKADELKQFVALAEAEAKLCKKIEKFTEMAEKVTSSLKRDSSSTQYEMRACVYGSLYLSNRVEYHFGCKILTSPQLLDIVKQLKR